MDLNLCRAMLLAILVVAMGGVMVVEQPGSSLLPRHNAFRHFCRLLRHRGLAAT